MSQQPPTNSLVDLPGAKSFQKCHTNPEQFGFCEDLAVGMFLEAIRMEAFSLPKGSKKTSEVWGEVYVTLCKGAKDRDGKRDGNGVLRGYKVWTTENAGAAKLKPLMVKIAKHFGNSVYRMLAGPGDSETMLELLAAQAMEQMDAAGRKKSEKANEKVARRMQNEMVEGELGFRALDQGVEGPSLAREKDSHDTEALALLAQPTGSVRQSQAVSSAASAAAAAVSKTATAFTTPVAAASRSNAVQSAIEALAGSEENKAMEELESSTCALDAAISKLAAGNVATVTKTKKERKRSKGLDAIKNARNLDRVDLTDGLESSLDRTAKDVLTTYQACFANSPNTKRQKTGKAIQERINLAMKEYKDLQDMNDPENAEDIAEVKRMLRNLRKERKRLDEPTANQPFAGGRNLFG